MNEHPGMQLAELFIAAGVAAWLNMEAWERKVFILRVEQFISRVFFQIRSDLVLMEARKVVTNV